MYAHAGAVVDDRIYITCGRRGTAYLKETYCYDPLANQWAACAEGPVERAWHGMASAKGLVYVIGGSNDEHGYRRDVLKVSWPSPASLHRRTTADAFIHANTRGVNQHAIRNPVSLSS